MSETGGSQTASILEALPLPTLLLAGTGEIVFLNPAAEQFFGAGAGVLLKQKLHDLLPPKSPLFELVGKARDRGASIAEHDVDLSTPRLGERIVDITITPMADPDGCVILLFHERGFTQRLERQLLHRGAARAVTGMAAMLAHEIKNPLAGIRGAAQLLEEGLPAADRALAELIRDEADRIRTLIDRMELLGDPSALVRLPVNIHEVLHRVRQVAETGFARKLHIVEAFDPSLPPVLGDRDHLIQAFLNIVRNAADAVPAQGDEIVLATGYRPGMRFSAPGNGMGKHLNLPLEVTVRDNGPGVAPDLLPYIFDPFVTTKSDGAGLGLALVAKIVGDHGGVIECDSQPQRTVFRVLLPVVNVDSDISIPNEGHSHG